MNGKTGTWAQEIERFGIVARRSQLLHVVVVFAELSARLAVVFQQIAALGHSFGGT